MHSPSVRVTWKKKCKAAIIFAQIYGFDLVRYRNLCSQNMYIAYRVAMQTVNKSLLARDFESLTYI